jgi:NADPH-dependent 2,4-dienoyl-CoA reductase/sulfur reductase-like enzyme
MTMRRRDFLKAGAAGAAMAGLSGCASMPGAAPKGRVVVVGGGYGGATAAKHIRLLDPSIEVTLIEPNESFVSCPISNMVLGGFKTIADITTPYSGLERHGVKVVRDTATMIDPERKVVGVSRGGTMGYDRVVVSPGVDFMWEALPSMAGSEAQAKVLHAWKAGVQTSQLRRQLEAMPDGGVYVLTIPLAPYRCPPGPYERACQVAAYFKARKPKSKVLVLDENADVTSKGALFKKAWSELYAGIIEYRPNSKVVDVDWRGNTAKLEFGDQKADVLNVVPPQRAGAIAAPFITANRRWCEVDWTTYESRAAKNVHVLGDALQIAPLMPKSGSMANGHGKIAAAAIVSLLNNEAPNPSPTLINTCYSMVSEKMAMHVTSVHKYDEKDRTMKTVPGSGGVSPAHSEAEGVYTLNWARHIWADALA